MKNINAKLFFEAMLSDIQSVIDNKEQKIVYTVNIPNYIYIDIDEENFQMAFMQFISNSCKHRDKNVFINVSVYMVNNKVSIRIEDNARGIPEQILDKILSPYYTYSPTYVTAGTGLGLAVAREIIKNHRGTLLISSEEYEGTIVAFSIPSTEDRKAINKLNAFSSRTLINRFSSIYVAMSDSLAPPKV